MRPPEGVEDFAVLLCVELAAAAHDEPDTGERGGEDDEDLVAAGDATSGDVT